MSALACNNGWRAQSVPVPTARRNGVAPVCTAPTTYLYQNIKNQKVKPNPTSKIKNIQEFKNKNKKNPTSKIKNPKVL